jgi:hypothetical protein
MGKFTSCYDMGEIDEEQLATQGYIQPIRAWPGKTKGIRAAIATVGAFRGAGTASSRILP